MGIGLIFHNFLECKGITQGCDFPSKVEVISNKSLHSPIVNLIPNNDRDKWVFNVLYL